MFKKSFITPLTLAICILFIPAISHAYVIYNKTSRQLNVHDRAIDAGINKRIPAGGSTACKPSSEGCYGHRDFKVTLGDRSGKFLCSYKTFIGKGETGIYFLINQSQPNNNYQKGWCYITMKHATPKSKIAQ